MIRRLSGAFLASKKYKFFFFLSIRICHLLFFLVNFLELFAVFCKSFYLPCPFIVISCVTNFLCAVYQYSGKRTVPVSRKLLFVNFYCQAAVVLSMILSLSTKLAKQRVEDKIEVLKMGVVALILFHIALPVSIIAAVQVHERLDHVQAEKSESIEGQIKGK